MSFNFPFILSFVFLGCMEIEFCLYCGEKIKNHKQLTKEHLVPLSKGGNNTLLNKKTCCFACNNWRGNMDLEQWKIEVCMLARNGKKKKRAGGYGRMYNAQDLTTIVENIFYWQDYISQKGQALMRVAKVQPKPKPTKNKDMPHIRKYVGGGVYCYICKTRGLESEHQHELIYKTL